MSSILSTADKAKIIERIIGNERHVAERQALGSESDAHGNRYAAEHYEGDMDNIGISMNPYRHQQGRLDETANRHRALADTLRQCHEYVIEFFLSQIPDPAKPAPAAGGDE